jgi:hypothetical protein
MFAGMAKATHHIAIPPAPDTHRLLDPKGAVEYLKEHWGIRRSVRTLQQMRRDGDGPRYRRHGNDVMYGPPAIDEWVVEQFGTEVSSTSEESALRQLTVTAETTERAPHARTVTPVYRTRNTRLKG